MVACTGMIPTSLFSRWTRIFVKFLAFMGQETFHSLSTSPISEIDRTFSNTGVSHSNLCITHMRMIPPTIGGRTSRKNTLFA